MPGLINAHERLITKSAYTPWTLDTVKAEPVTFQSIRAVRNAEHMLREGVTTIRECGCRERINLSVAKAAKDKLIKAPTVIACGRPISMIGGHCYYYSHEIAGCTEAVAAVRTELKHGAHFIKVHATGGAGTKEGSPTWRQLSLEELTAIAREAHANDKRVCSHAIGREGIKNTILAGIDSVEHGHYLDDELLDMMARQGTYYVPTLTGYIPLAKNGLALGRPQWMVDKANALLEKHQEVMSLLKKYPEIVIATGSDSTGSVATEIQALCQSGFGVIETLRFATRNGADVLGILDDVGTLEPGKEADIIVIDGNPLEDITAVGRIKQVVKSGEFI
jgi:imidazolonepropionase-like amidohydrolase